MPFLKEIKVSLTKSRIRNAKRNSLRKAVFTSNSKYIGEWLDDVKHGKGIEISENSIYKGDWSRGRRNGYGVLMKKLYNNVYCKRYAGNWIDGRKQGIGGQWYKDGSYYEGYFHESKRQGFGRFWFYGGFYQGDWKNNVFHGEGMLVGDENRYEGQFFNGKKEGWGIVYNLKTGQVQEGYWENGKCLESVIKDSNWRQSAIIPTPYPIPKLELKSLDEILNERKIRSLKLINEKWNKDSPVESHDYINNRRCSCKIKEKLLSTNT